jgi:hypothetical protein
MADKTTNVKRRFVAATNALFPSLKEGQAFEVIKIVETETRETSEQTTELTSLACVPLDEAQTEAFTKRGFFPVFSFAGKNPPMAGDVVLISATSTKSGNKLVSKTFDV